MKKIIMSVATIVTMSSASFLGIPSKDKAVNNVSFYTGKVAVENIDESTNIYEIGFSGNGYYNNGVLAGFSAKIEYVENPYEIVETGIMLGFSERFRLGYSFGKIARGFAIYGLVDLNQMLYTVAEIDEDIGEEEDIGHTAFGFGFGIGAEYVFENGLIISISSGTSEMKNDEDYKFDYEKTIVGIGYYWDRVK